MTWRLIFFIHNTPTTRSFLMHLMAGGMIFSLVVPSSRLHNEKSTSPFKKLVFTTNETAIFAE